MDTLIDKNVTPVKQMGSTNLAARHTWPKGVSGNPKGRPVKADCLLSCIKDELTKKHLNVKGSPTNEQMIAMALVQKASMGDLKAIELTLSYTAVKPTQGLDINMGGKLEVCDAREQLISRINSLSSVLGAGETVKAAN